MSCWTYEDDDVLDIRREFAEAERMIEDYTRWLKEFNANPPQNWIFEVNHFSGDATLYQSIWEGPKMKLQVPSMTFPLFQAAIEG